MYLTYKDLKDFYEIANEMFAGMPRGYISNRINSYSLDLLDLSVHNKEFPELDAYAVVTYNTSTELVLTIENHYFKRPRTTFNNLIDSVNWVKKVIQDVYNSGKYNSP